MSYPELAERATHFTPYGEPESIEPYVTDIEFHAMKIALDHAAEALSDGNPPVGAVLIDNEDGFLWAGRTSDKTERHLVRHAEMRVYDLAQPKVGDDLKNCTLITTAQLCTSCTPYYAGGKIGKIVVGAERNVIHQITGIMRPRNINMADLIKDGHTDTVVVENVMALESLRLFAQYGKLQQHELPKDVSDTLQEIVSSSTADI